MYFLPQKGGRECNENAMCENEDGAEGGKKFGLVYLFDWILPLVGGQKPFESFPIPFVLPLWQMESFKKKQKRKGKRQKTLLGEGGRWGFAE